MNKIMIELHIPAVSKQFDVFAPVDVPIENLSKIFADGVAELTNGNYVSSGCEHLCIKAPNGLLNPKLTLKDYGVKDGLRLYLI